MLGSVSNPIKETMDQVNAEIGQIKEETTATTKTATAVVRGTNGHSPKRASATNKRSKPASTASPTGNGQQDDAFGSWSSHDAKPDFGSWATSEDDEE
jgi:L-serine deaminase